MPRRTLKYINKFLERDEYVCDCIAYVGHWSRLPCEVGDAPSLEALKALLDGAVNNLV